MNDMTPMLPLAGLTKLDAAVSLLRRIDAAREMLACIVDAFDRLPEAYRPGSDYWLAWNDVDYACELISSAYATLDVEARL